MALVRYKGLPKLVWTELKHDLAVYYQRLAVLTVPGNCRMAAAYYEKAGAFLENYRDCVADDQKRYFYAEKYIQDNNADIAKGMRQIVKRRPAAGSDTGDMYRSMLEQAYNKMDAAVKFY
jgi:hypothetical protein